MDSYRLQANLNSLVKWARDWLLRFNVSKCKHMSIGTKPVTSYSIVDISNISHSLSTTDCEKDLGVWISSTMQPSTQCQKAYSKAIYMQSLAIIKRTFKFLSKESFNILYKTYIRPHNEFKFVFKPGIHIMQRTLICWRRSSIVLLNLSLTYVSYPMRND